MSAGLIPSVVCQSLYFVENGAGTYTGQIQVPAGSVLLDVIVHAEALWSAGTSAALNVGDTTDPDGFFATVNLKATDLTADQSIMFDKAGDQAGADIDMIDTTQATAGTGRDLHNRRQYSTANRTIQAEVVSVGAGTAGRTRVFVIYARDVNSKTITQ